MQGGSLPELYHVALLFITVHVVTEKGRWSLRVGHARPPGNSFLLVQLLASLIQASSFLILFVAPFFRLFFVIREMILGGRFLVEGKLCQTLFCPHCLPKYFLSTSYIKTLCYLAF